MFFHKDRNLPSSLPPTSIFTMAVELFPDGATLTVRLRIRNDLEKQRGRVFILDILHVKTL